MMEHQKKIWILVLIFFYKILIFNSFNEKDKHKTYTKYYYVNFKDEIIFFFFNTRTTNIYIQLGLKYYLKNK